MSNMAEVKYGFRGTRHHARFGKSKDPPFNSHGSTVFKNNKDKWITPDRDGHTGRTAWKMFDSKGNRIGTYDIRLRQRLKR